MQPDFAPVLCGKQSKMITLRLPRNLAFLSNLPTFPFRTDQPRFVFPWQRKYQPRPPREKRIRLVRPNPAKGDFVINLNKFDGIGKDIGLRRKQFRR